MSVFADERGQVMVEYLVVSVFVCLVLAVAFSLFARVISASFGTISFMWSLPFP